MARRSWSMQDAKNRFSEVVEAARRRALMCGCAILISDVPDRYRYAAELRRRERDPMVVAWFERQRITDLFLSVISIGE